MPNIDLSILNQRATPAFFADTLANRPAPSFVGRIFISTDTLDLYRDTGTAWLLLSPSSTGTITGSGAAGQVTIFSGASSITGTNNLFWDTSNLRLGINTNTPGAALDIHSTASTLMQLNQTTATNDTRIAFQNGGVAKWRIGSFYNLGSNDYAVNDATLNINRFTIKSSSGQTFVGDETTSSGLFVVNNSSADAHLVVLGATAPSFRVRNAGVGASLQFGLGLATTTNNFIQGATGGEFCIFNDSLTAQPILFGIKDAGLGNTQEAARISASRNFLIGTSIDAGYKLYVSGTSFSTNFITPSATVGGQYLLNYGANAASRSWRLVSDGYNFGDLCIQQSTTQSGTTYSDKLVISANGKVGIGTSTPNRNTEIISSGGAVLGVSSSTNGAGILYGRIAMYTNAASNSYIDYGGEIRSYSGAGIDNSDLRFYTANATPSVERMRITNGGNLLLNTMTDLGQKLQVSGNSIFYSTSGTLIKIEGTSTANNTTNMQGRNSAGDVYEIGIASTGYVNSLYPSIIGKGAYLYGAQNLGIIAENASILFQTSTGASSVRMTIKNSGVINFANVPTSAVGLVSGDIYRTGNVLNIVP